MTAAAVLGQAHRSRSDWLWVMLPYAVLGGCLILTAATTSLAQQHVLAVIVVVLALIAWHGWWVIAHPQWAETRLAPMAVYFAGLVIATDYLTQLSMTFYPLYLVCYPMAFVTLPGSWAYVGVAVTTVVGLLGSTFGTWSMEGVIMAIGAAVLVSVAGGAIRALEAETGRRRQAIATLTQTQSELERSLAENLALQDRLVAEARDAGVASERARLAGEIHDTLAAGLAGVLSQLEALDTQLPQHEPSRQRLNASLSLARESLQEARRSVRAMRPGPLADSTLPNAVANVVQRFDTDHLPVQCTITGDTVPVPEQVEEVLLRAVTEALTNIVKHAQATSAHVTLSFLDDEVALDIVDDGGGFCPTAGPVETANGQGLTIMRERVTAMSGHLTVDTVPDRGTTVTVIMPLTAQPEGKQQDGWYETHQDSDR